MKSNQVSIIVLLVLCVVLGGLLFYMGHSNEENYGWNPSEMYGELGSNERGSSSFTNATLSGSSSNSGVALSMPTRSFSLRARTANPSYTLSSSEGSGVGSSSPISYSQSPISYGQSPIAHMTSTSEYRSFGGGGNGGASTGGSMRSNSSNLSPIAYSPSPISYSQSPIAYSSSSLPSLQGGAGGRLSGSTSGLELMQAQQGIASASAVYGNYGTSSYGSTYGNSRNGIRGRQNATPNFYDAWLKWLAENENTEGGYGTFNDGMFTYTEDQLRAAWKAWVAWMEDNGSAVTPGMSSFDAWWEWMLAGGYDGYTYGNYTYRWVPVGNILPLLLLAMLYAIILFVKRNKIAQL